MLQPSLYWNPPKRHPQCWETLNPKCVAAKAPIKEFYKRVLISILDVAKTGARVSARQRVVGTLSAIAFDRGSVRMLCAKLAMCARREKLCARQ